MNITKVPLARRLEQLSSGRTAHPEYIPSLIDDVRRIEVTDYFMDVEEEILRLQKCLHLTDTEMAQWSCQDLAARIDSWYHSDSPVRRNAAAEAMDLLAAPWMVIFRSIQKYQQGKVVRL